MGLGLGQRLTRISIKRVHSGMESKAHYTLVGSLVLIFLFAGLAFVVWLSGSNLDQEFDDYVVRFEGPVRGLEQSSDVRFSGIRVGEVTRIRIDADDPKFVLVTIQVFEETPVDIKSYAQLEAQGLTGLNYIQLFSGGSDLPLVKYSDERKSYIIEGRRSQIDNLLYDGGSVVESVQMALNTILKTLDTESTQDFKQILSNIEAITSQYRQDPLTMNRIEKTLKNMDRAANDVSLASTSVDLTALETRVVINDEFAPLLKSLTRTVGELEQTIISARTMVDGTSELVDTTNGAVTDFSVGSLKKIEDATTELTQLLDTLNRVAEDLERNPTRFIIGQDREVLELPQ